MERGNNNLYIVLTRISSCAKNDALHSRRTQSCTWWIGTSSRPWPALGLWVPAHQTPVPHSRPQCWAWWALLLAHPQIWQKKVRSHAFQIHDQIWSLLIPCHCGTRAEEILRNGLETADCSDKLQGQECKRENLTMPSEHWNTFPPWKMQTFCPPHIRSSHQPSSQRIPAQARILPGTCSEL